ncbi:hypothetical protein, partial [Geobacillus stearothermophilus]|uniref:hypothetical protein n=1 Tax=Geobacillus stearothermophilus TaxID=1422 RepID=UPI003D19A4A9
SCLITFNSGNPSGIESTYETSLMLISPLTLWPGSRQYFLFFVTKSQNLVMNQKMDKEAEIHEQKSVDHHRRRC